MLVVLCVCFIAVVCLSLLLSVLISVVLGAGPPQLRPGAAGGLRRSLQLLMIYTYTHITYSYVYNDNYDYDYNYKLHYTSSVRQVVPPDSCSTAHAWDAAPSTSAPAAAAACRSTYHY